MTVYELWVDDFPFSSGLSWHTLWHRAGLVEHVCTYPKVRDSKQHRMANTGLIFLIWIAYIIMGSLTW
jgi:hypothetical protein